MPKPPHPGGGSQCGSVNSCTPSVPVLQAIRHWPNVGVGNSSPPPPPASSVQVNTISAATQPAGSLWDPHLLTFAPVPQPLAMDLVPQAAAIDAVLHPEQPPPVLQQQPQPEALPQATPAHELYQTLTSTGSLAESSAGESWDMPPMVPTQHYSLDTASDTSMGTSAYSYCVQQQATSAHDATNLSVASSTDRSWVQYHRPAQAADDESTSLFQSVASDGSLAPTVQAPPPPASSLPQAPPPAKLNGRPPQAQPLPKAKSKPTTPTDFYGVPVGRRAIHPNMSSASSCSHIAPTYLHSQESVFFFRVTAVIRGAKKTKQVQTSKHEATFQHTSTELFFFGF